ncbi:hypothetical protein B0H13DRAFT_2254618 [Mycena leptocephala]|nr:hypothetical protein B0H13DRAFT_2254618 [Mycena leptocephala]
MEAIHSSHCNNIPNHIPTFSSHLHSHSHREHCRPSYDPAPSSSALSLPRTLARPPFTDISRDALATAAPELAAVPTEFIRHGLRAKSPQMQASIAALAPSHLPPSLPCSHLPSALTVPLHAPPASAPAPPSYPTHALAIAPQPPKCTQPDPAQLQTIFPVHAVVLAAHCAKLLRLPAPLRSHSGPAAAVTLPVLPIALPSPQAFAILHAFMYTHRLDAALTCSSSPSRTAGTDTPPRPSSPPPSVRHTLASHLCAAAAGNPSALMSHARHVNELWQDMVALGMYDTSLWDALDLAWEVVLGALNLAVE